MLKAARKLRAMNHWPNNSAKTSNRKRTLEIPATSARQEALLAEALAALRRAEEGLVADESYDVIAVDLTEARRSLGEMVGRGVDQDVIAAVFARFCIGK